jgi:hypothetical protein
MKLTLPSLLLPLSIRTTASNLCSATVAVTSVKVATSGVAAAVVVAKDAVAVVVVKVVDAVDEEATGSSVDLSSVVPAGTRSRRTPDVDRRFD